MDNVNVNIDTLISMIHPHVPYQPGINYDDWKRALSRFVPDMRDQIVLQRFAGYLMLPDNCLQKFLVIEGPAASGKTTLMKTMGWFAGEHGSTHVPAWALHERHMLGGLVGKLVSLQEEWQKLSRDSAGTFKAILGGDPVTVDRKYLKPFETILPTKWIITTCDWESEMLDSPFSIGGRAKVVKTEKSNKASPRDIDLRREVAPKEWRTQALGWAVDGLLRLLKQLEFLNCE